MYLSYMVVKICDKCLQPYYDGSFEKCVIYDYNTTKMKAPDPVWSPKLTNFLGSRCVGDFLCYIKMCLNIQKFVVLKSDFWLKLVDNVLHVYNHTKMESPDLVWSPTLVIFGPG